MPSHNIKGPKNKLLDAESHNSVSAVVRANANNWLANTKALINKEKSIANQYKTQSADTGKANNVEIDTGKLAATSNFMNEFNGINNLNGIDNLNIVDLNLNDEILNTNGKLSHIDDLKPLDDLKSLSTYVDIVNGKVNAEEISAYVQTLDTEKAAATSQFMSNYNDNQLYEVSPGNNIKVVDLNQNLNDEILGTSTADLEITANNNLQASLVSEVEKVQVVDDAAEPTFHFKDLNKDGKVSTAEDERWILDHGGYTINGQFIKADGRTYAQVLAEMANDEQQNISGSFIESDESTIVPIDDDSIKELEILKNGEFTLSDDSVVDAGGHDAIWHENLLEAKKEAEKNAAEIMKEIEDESAMTSLEKALQNDQYLGASGLDAVHAGDDTWEDADGNLTNNQTVIKETKEKIERALALQKDPHLVADEKLIATANRIKEEKARRFAEAKAEAKANADKLNAEMELERDVKENAESTPLGESQNERLKDIKRKEKYQDQAKSTPIGQGVAQREGKLQRKLKREREEKAAEQRAAHDQYQNDKIDNIANESDKSWSNWRKMMKEQEALLNQASADRIERHIDKNQAQKDWNMHVYKDPYAFSTLSYPSNLTQNNENGHYMLFYVNVQNQTKYEYEGLDSEHKKVMVGDMTETPEYWTEYGSPSAGGTFVPYKAHKGANAEGDIISADYRKQIIKNGGPGNILYNNMTILRKSRKGPLTGINTRFQTTTRITDSVALYLPPGINDNLSANYGDSMTGMAGYLAMSGVDLVQQIKDHDFAGAASTLFDSGGALVEEAAKKLAAGAFESFTGSEGIRETFDKAFGQTLNPYIEVTYSSFGMRDFNYTFKFAPKSEKETDEVQAIINLFRFHMAPELKNTHHRYMTLPSTFDIHYMWQSGAGDRATAEENSFYNKIATCVLTRCDVDYTPEGVRSFGDGAPTQINMALSFKETEMLTKDKIAQGF